MGPESDSCTKCRDSFYSYKSFCLDNCSIGTYIFTTDNINNTNNSYICYDCSPICLQCSVNPNNC